MKVKLTRPDGTIIEADGTAEECAAIVGLPMPVAVAPIYVPYFRVLPPYQQPYPWTWEVISADDLPPGVQPAPSFTALPWNGPQ